MQLNPLAIEAEVRSSSILFGRGARCSSTLWRLRRRCEAAPSFRKRCTRQLNTLAIKAEVKGSSIHFGKRCICGTLSPSAAPSTAFLACGPVCSSLGCVSQQSGCMLTDACPLHGKPSGAPLLAQGSQPPDHSILSSACLAYTWACLILEGDIACSHGGSIL